MYLIAFHEVSDNYTYSVTVPTIFEASSVEAVFVDMDDRLSSIAKLYNEQRYDTNERIEFNERYNSIFGEYCVEDFIYESENGPYMYYVPHIIPLKEWLESAPTLEDNEMSQRNANQNK